MISVGIKDMALLTKLDVNIQNFANRGFLLVFMHLVCISTHCVMTVTVLRVMKNSKRSLIEKIDSLLPVVLLVAYFFINFTYCELAWNAPGVILFISGAYFCLCSTKLIISNVTKQRFSTFEDMNLHVPFLFSLIMLPLHNEWSKGKSAE